MNVTETKSFMRTRLFSEDVADTIVIDGVEVLGHKDEEDVAGPHMGVFSSKVTLVVPPDVFTLPVPGQQMVVDGDRITVSRAAHDAVSMTIHAVRNAS